MRLQGGKFDVEREKRPIEPEAMDPGMIFEQEPAQILDALLPLYLNSCLLRSLQEALASELAARMNAMSNTTDNAKELRKVRGGKRGEGSVGTGSVGVRGGFPRGGWRTRFEPSPANGARRGH